MQLLATLISIALGIVVVYDRVRLRGWSSAWQGPLIAMALCVPPWLNVPFRSIEFTSRLCMGGLILAIFFFRPSTPSRRLHIYPSDWAIVALMIAIAFCEISSLTITPFGFLHTLLIWLIPYMLGRVFLRDERDLKAALSAICLATLVMSLITFVEGIGHKNWITTILQKQFGTGEAPRWGMKRSLGPQTHPIYWGLTLAMMLPFLLEAARRAKAGDGPSWWRWAPWTIVPGIAATGSRSAQVAALIVLGMNLFYQLPKYRTTFIAIAGFALAVFFVYRADIIDLLSQYVSEPDSTENFVTIRGVKYEYSGTLHRDLLNVVYKDAIDKAGFTGYGTHQNGIPRDPDMDERFDSVDNHYLLFFLQYGQIGTVAFAIFVVCGCLNFIPSLTYGGRLAGFAATLLGSIIAVTIALRGVWMCMDFGWFLLLYLGMAGALETARQQEAVPIADGGYGPVR
jgi:hypothetical protein